MTNQVSNARPLRIVIYSPAFHPLLGGLETVVRVLAEEWSALGQEVTVVTATPNPDPDEFPFKVLRRPAWLPLLRCVRNSDVFVHANVSLWGLIPWLLCGWRRPVWVATHHGWYQVIGQSPDLLDRSKRFLARFASLNISVSHAVDRVLGLNGLVIPNPYDNRRFRVVPGISRDKDLVFLGRLNSDKGVDVLIEAMAILKQRGQTRMLTVIGAGPERANLEKLAENLGVTNQITFAGPRSGEDLVGLLNAHRVLVVPSRWHEPFGVVALEGIACGCVVVGSAGGGLPEAIGPCGVTFENGNAAALADALAELHHHPELCQSLIAHAPAHLAAHEKSIVAGAYLAALRSAHLRRRPNDRSVS